MRWEQYSELKTTTSPRDKKKDVVLEDWTFYSERLGCNVTVEKGFEFDWDSVPRLPIVYLLFKGRAKEEACAHDWLYVHGRACGKPIERKTADLVMHDAMVVKQRKARYKVPIYLGVRIGGWRGWNKYRREEILDG
jgi:hypothetical protein